MTPTLALALATLLAAGEPVREPPPSPPTAQDADAPGPEAPPGEPPTASPTPGPAEPSEPAAPPAGALEPSTGPEVAPPPVAPADAGVAPSTPAPAAPPAPPGPSPTGVAPGLAVPPTQPPDAAEPSFFSREYSVQAGWSAMSLAGLGAQGPTLRASLSTPPAARLQGAIPLVSTSLFAGETGAGLLVRSITLDAELWFGSGPMRFGAGLGIGLVGYRRETRSEWPTMLVPGVRAGVELAALRWRSGAIVLGGSGAVYFGEEVWASATIGLGFRFGGAPAAVRPASAPAGGTIRAE